MGCDPKEGNKLGLGISPRRLDGLRPAKPGSVLLPLRANPGLARGRSDEGCWTERVLEEPGSRSRLSSGDRGNDRGGVQTTPNVVIDACAVPTPDRAFTSALTLCSRADIGIGFHSS